MSVVVTRMQDLASEFSKKIPVVISPEPTAGGGVPPPAPTPSPACGRVPGASAPMLGPKPWSPSTFQQCSCAPATVEGALSEDAVCPSLCLI